MKITHNKVGQNLNLTDAQKADKSGKTGKAEKAEKAIGTTSIEKESGAADATKVAVSSRAQDMKRIKEIATSGPDVDEAKIEKFQKLIDSGKYEVNSEAVADKMVDDHLLYS